MEPFPLESERRICYNEIVMKTTSCETPVIYYDNELEDEFSKARITPRKIDESYDYDGGVLRKIGRFFLYRLIARPFGFLFLKIKYHHRIVNRKCLKQARGTGFYLYGNHTNAMADPFIPSMITYPVGVYAIAHSNNVSMPVLGRLTPALGAIPLPDGKAALKNFTEAIDRAISKKNCVIIYPEAHIWPFYTGIRNFKDASFRYPVKHDVPVFCFTNTYQKKRGKTPQIVTYVEGPFFVDKSLPHKDQKKDLRDRVYAAMKKNAEHSNVELVRYVKREPADQTSNN